MAISVVPRSDRGASAVEYGLIVFAIAAVLALTVFAFGNVVSDLFRGSCTAIEGKVNSGGGC